MLKWARTAPSGPAPWDGGTCAYAAKKGHLKVLQWAQENGAPWTWLVGYYAVEHEHILQWIREKQLPTEFINQNGEWVPKNKLKTF